MPEEIIFCPSCNRKVRIPSEMLGTAVKCPLCGVVFTAPMPPGVGPPSAREPQGEYYPSPILPVPPYSTGGASGRYGEQSALRGPQEWGQYYEEERRAHAKSAVMVPAIALLVVGILGLLASIVSVAFALLPPPPPPPNMPEMLVQLQQQSHGPAAAVVQLLFTVLNVVIIFAATQMMRLSTYGLALAGSILAMINIGNCCCVLGLPFGIWALVVLLRPEVKAAFR